MVGRSRALSSPPSAVRSYGQGKALTAAAHKLARLIYAMLTRGQEYTDQGQDYFEERYRRRVVATRHEAGARNANGLIERQAVEKEALQSTTWRVFLERPQFTLLDMEGVPLGRTGPG